jgi:hypothetical protein
MMAQWNPALLDQLVAPGISSFRAAQIPDVSGEFSQAEYWLANHFLNTVLGVRFAEGVRQVVVAFLRRAQEAHAAFLTARRLTLDFLAQTQPGNPGVRRYYAAVGAWEVFTLQSAIAMDLFRWLNDGTGAFEKKDGSTEYRLYTIANQIKHTASCVESGQCRPEHTVPLWLTANGVESFEGIRVSYEEAAEVLRDICRVADRLQNPAALRAAAQRRDEADNARDG